MKRIIIVIESLHLGGSEKSLVSLLNNMDLGNYIIEILLFKRGGEFEKFIPNSIKISTIEFWPGLVDRIKFKIFRLINSKNKYHNAQLFWKSIYKKIPSFGGNYDIAIAWAQGFATYYVAHKINAKNKYAWINTDLIRAGYDTNDDKYHYTRFDKLIGVSPYVQSELRRIYQDLNIDLIKDIVDIEEVFSWSKEEGEIKFNPEVLNIVSVGRLAKAKCFELAIKAIKVIKNAGVDVHLYIIGEGPERSMLEATITENSLTNDVTLMGYMENPFPYIKACDIYLQTSSFEGLGRTIIEAAILKKPIVTTNFPTASQILVHKETGYIVDMNPDAIANAIIELNQNADLKNMLIVNLEDHSRKETKKSLDSIYGLLDMHKEPK